MGIEETAKNKANELGGAAKEFVGSATDNPELEAEGRVQKDESKLKEVANKVSEKAEDAVEYVKEAAQRVGDSFKKDE
ncbi:CsbD family protein [Arcanobacterium bovis]|uniref:CsbD family protein n=1 Tax=Arcanobacterium bovis TaxID=2529275 RepID=A0A4Q9UZN4_9ACTO|nr:CsbD family protein [Arcanobacterium bovis]TBW21474.1 CsbD family protein [Arcanobacterium bovis]